jgi:hypothetical protein
MDTDTPSSLPGIDTVEVVDLRAVDANRVTEYMANAHAAPCWSVGGTEAQAIASLWRRLPAGEVMRCHVPPFGFRFFAAGRLVSEASVCWKCNTLYGTVEGRELSFGFDGPEPAARHLLAEAERLSGIRVTR